MNRQWQDLRPREQRRLIRAMLAYLDPKFHFPILGSLCVAWALWLSVWATLALFEVVGPLDRFLVMAIAISLLAAWGGDLWDDIQRERQRLRNLAKIDEARQ